MKTSLVSAFKFLLPINVFFCAVSANGQGMLKEKMSYEEVLKENGAPLSKDVMESKRIDIWTYPQERVTFREGRVIKVESLVKPKHSESVFELSKKRLPSNKANKERDAEEADKILKDIFQGQ